MIDGPTLQIPAVRHAHHDRRAERIGGPPAYGRELVAELMIDRKSTRLNSSHPSISYAVFCLKKKKTLFSRCLFFPRYPSQQDCSEGYGAHCGTHDRSFSCRPKFPVRVQPRLLSASSLGRSCE